METRILVLSSSLSLSQTFLSDYDTITSDYVSAPYDRVSGVALTQINHEIDTFIFIGFAFVSD